MADPTTDALARFDAKWSGATTAANQSDVNAPPQVTATGIADPNEAVRRFDERFGQGVMPQSQTAVNQLRGVEAVPSLSLTEREGRRNAAGELVPISGEGIGTDYWELAKQRGPEAQLQLLKKLYPDRPSRILESGDLVLELIDSATGKPKDVMINAAGMNAHDLMDLAVQAPEIAAGVATAIATKGRGALRTAGQIVLSSLAAGVMGGARDVGARLQAGIDVNLPEIARSRGSDMALDMFLQTGGAGLAKLTRTASPFAREIERGTLEFDSDQAQKYFKAVFGEDYPMMPSEITGSPMLRAIEAAEAPQPGARTVMQRTREKREGVVRRIISRALGKVPSEEALGAESIELLRDARIKPLEDALLDARNNLQQKGQRNVLRTFDEATGMVGGERITESAAGARTLQEFDSRLAQAKAKVDEVYQVVHDLPGGTGDVLPGDAAAKAAADIRKELPAALKEVEESTGLVDEFGRESTRTVQKREVLKSGVTEGLLSALSDLEKLKGGKVSLQSLTNMKRAAYDEIAKTEAVPGVKERWFKKIATAYERGIDEGVESVGDPALKAALTQAKETYKKELLPFDRPGVRELAKGEFERQVSPEQVVTRLFEGPQAIENYRKLKEVLGPNSKSFNVIKRAWVDTQLSDPGLVDPVTGTIKAEALRDRLLRLNKDKKEIADEVFGERRLKLLSDELSIMAGGQKLKSLDVSEVRTLMQLPSPTASDFKALIKMQRNRDIAYTSSVLGGIKDGSLELDTVKPTEFVTRLRNSNTPLSEVKQAMDDIGSRNPKVRENIATAELYRLINEASEMDAAGAMRRLRGEPLNISPSKLAEAVGTTPDEQERTLTLLGAGKLPIIPGLEGPTRKDVVENLVRLLAPTDAKMREMAAAGGLGAGARIQQLFSTPFRYATSYAQKLALATAWTDQGFNKLISNRAFSPGETAAMANAWIASEPIVRRFIDTLGDETRAGEAISSLKSSIDRYVQEYANSPSARERQELGKLAAGDTAKVRIQPMR